MVREIAESGQDLYGEIAVTDLVEDQREYPLPIDDTSSAYSGGSIKLIRVEVSYSGADADWKVCQSTDLDMIASPLIETKILEVFNKSNPFYAEFDRSIWLLPRPDSSDDVAASNANLRLFYVKRPDEMTAGSDIPDVPKDFLNILSAGIKSDVLESLGRINESRAAKNEFFSLLKQAKMLETQEGNRTTIKQQLETWK